MDYFSSRSWRQITEKGRPFIYGTVNLSYALIITRSINSQKRAQLSFGLSEFVRRNPEKKDHEVRLAIGELSQIEHEQLRFCYQSITKETPLEGSTLKIDKTEALVECPHCSYRGRRARCDLSMSGLRQDRGRNAGKRMRNQIDQVQSKRTNPHR
jgi:Zn finger protein HypA/HybF involved in hydrogenase expression